MDQSIGENRPGENRLRRIKKFATDHVQLEVFLMSVHPLCALVSA